MREDGQNNIIKRRLYQLPTQNCLLKHKMHSARRSSIKCLNMFHVWNFLNRQGSKERHTERIKLVCNF